VVKERQHVAGNPWIGYELRKAKRSWPARMLIFRILGVLMVVLGFAAFAYDGASMLASPGSLVWTSLNEHWAHVSPAGLEKAQAFVHKLNIPGLWPALGWLLALPAWMSLGGVGVAIYWIGRRRKRPTIVPD
jgi:hypothetical protein